jgi:hypothetical protein
MQHGQPRLTCGIESLWSNTRQATNLGFVQVLAINITERTQFTMTCSRAQLPENGILDPTLNPLNLVFCQNRLQSLTQFLRQRGPGQLPAQLDGGAVTFNIREAGRAKAQVVFNAVPVFPGELVGFEVDQQFD